MAKLKYNLEDMIKRLSSEAGVNSNDIVASEDGGGLVFIVQGMVGGDSLTQANVRRIAVDKFASDSIRDCEIPIQISYMVDDAISRFCGASLNMLRSEIGLKIGGVNVYISHNKLEILISLADQDWDFLSLKNRAYDIIRRLKIDPGLSFNSDSILLPLPEMPRVADVKILEMVKILSPVNVVQLIERLVSLQPVHEDLDEKDVSRVLDRLRRQGLVTHLSKGFYAMTSAGLSAVPRRSGRHSSDILRVLHLGTSKAYNASGGAESDSH